MEAAGIMVVGTGLVGEPQHLAGVLHSLQRVSENARFLSNAVNL